ncbi:hypothetical protein [Pseudomonas sp. NFX15]|uniref:hypothetical protein n=1 Tax=Pseudomonas sp. NFX15 TaxID=2816958 RepID=UPI003B8C1C0B
MDIDEKAPGNVSQQGGAGISADNEAGHDPKRTDTPQKKSEAHTNGGKEELDNDQDSTHVPDASGSAMAPNNPRNDAIAKENSYSPDFKSEPEHKPVQDGDIDTQGG